MIPGQDILSLFLNQSQPSSQHRISRLPYLDIYFPNQVYNYFCQFPIAPEFFNPLLASLNYQQLASSPLERFNSDTQDQISEFEDQNYSKIEEHSSISKTEVTSPLIKLIRDTKTEIKSEEKEETLNFPNDPEICFEAQVKYIVQFFVNNYGITTYDAIIKMKDRYKKDIKLKAIFEALEKKYSKTNKTKEEMVKWIIRRSLKTCQQRIKGDQNQKKKLSALCKKYFTNYNEKSLNEHEESEDETNQDDDSNEESDEWIDSVLPFRKNSKNKTMNGVFLTELFQSEEFKQDFQLFLKEFDKVSEVENAEKIQRFTRTIVDYSKKGTFGKIAKYKRVPWLKVWYQNTKSMALELEKGKIPGKALKKVKESC